MATNQRIQPSDDAPARLGDAHAQPSAAEAATAPGRRLIVIALVCLVGLLLSGVLTVVHYRSHTDPSYQALCAVSDRINCESVALSPYSIWFGVPVSVWGISCYVAAAVLSLTGRWRRRPHPRWPIGLLSLLSVAAVGASAYLAYLSVTRIDSLCIYCTGLYVVNVAWLGASLHRRLSWKELWSSVEADVGALLERPRMALALSIGALAFVSLLVGLFPRYWEAAQPSEECVEQGSAGTDGGEHWIGAPDPVLTVVEYTDYQCPHCRRAHRDLRERMARSGVAVRLVHKHFPLDQACNPIVKRPFHGRACELSRFVECVGEQGKFWQANDAVFAALDRTRAAELELPALAAELGVEWADIQSCMQGPAVREVIDRDVEDGIALEIHGTPTYVVGDQRYSGRLPPGLLERAGEAQPSSDATGAQGSR